MEQVINFVTENWGTIAAVAVSVIVAGRAIAAATKNKTDDKVFAALYKVGKALGLKFK